MAIWAGAAKHVVTPYVGIGMEGNVREEGSRGVHDDLYARALVLTDEEGRGCGLVAVDVCMLTPEMVAQTRRWVAEGSSLAPEQVLVCAIHTHAGPTTVGIFGDPPDRAQLSLIARGAAGALLEAANGRVPARIGWTYGRAEEPTNNRRLRTRDGEVHMNWEGLDPDEVLQVLGPTDPEIGVLRVDHLSGEPLATVINYALHPAILAGDNWLLSADWPGYALGVIEKLRGGVGVFLNGATGNVNHINYRRPNQQRGFYEAHRLGTIVGCAAMQALLGVEELAGEAEIAAVSRTISVPGRQVTQEQLQAAQGVLAAHQGPLVQAQTDGAPEALFASEVVKLAARGQFSEEVEVQVWRVGQGAMFVVPAELFVEYQLQLKRLNPLTWTFVVGYANDYQGYVPTPEALAQGGYEARPMSWSKLSPQAGQTLVDAGLDLLSSVTR